MNVPSVYLIEAQNGLIKIGFGSDPGQRAGAVRCHSPILTRLIAHWPASALDEVELHERFEPFRKHGEWFLPEGDFGEFVAVKRGLNVVEIPDWTDLDFNVRLLFTKRRNIVGRRAKGMYRVHSQAEASA